MKKNLITVALAFAVSLALVGMLYAGVLLYGAGGVNYGRYSVSMTVPGSPVMVMPQTQSTGLSQIQPGRGSYQICNRQSSSVNVICWDYSGATPAATASNVMEIPIGQCRNDGQNLDPVLGLAYACAPEATGTANIDSVWR